MRIKLGDIVKHPLYNEFIKIDEIKELEHYFYLKGTKIYSRENFEEYIPKEEINDFQLVKNLIDFDSDAYKAFLVYEALRLKYASIYDPYLAMNVSKIDPLPFQIEAVYDYILKLPKIRFLLADDPGAGKTIMAGIVLKELKIRSKIQRILIVTPGHLKYQWQREMQEKFQEEFVIVDRNYMNQYPGINPWKRENQVITSMDFAKQKEVISTLDSVDWDLVIVDEAHKMAAYFYDTLEKTERYKLGEIISRNTYHLLFITATPHKGDPENFRLLLDLLNPGLFSQPKILIESIQNKENTIFLRRLKEDMIDFEGRSLFTKRIPKTIEFRLSDKEKILYNELSEYVINQYMNFERFIRSLSKRSIAFALSILQRRMASSTYALMKSLERRKQKLIEILNNLKQGKNIILNMSSTYLPNIEIYQEKFENSEEVEIWQEEEKCETFILSRDKNEIEREISTIDNLISKAKEIVDNFEEVKLKELRQSIHELLQNHKDQKILIFTESKDTLEYLVEKIKSWGYNVNFIHGGMNIRERIEAEKVFRDNTQIMVATEAAGEGINLQFCNILINYDIPWNPNRLEQRIGRVHRYGQQKDVYIFNLVAKDTKEGSILLRLLQKLDEIRKDLGTDKVFDVIGEVFHGKNLYNLIVEALMNIRSTEEVIKEIDIKIDTEYINKIKNMLDYSLVTRHIDYTRIKEIADSSKEHRLSPEYVESFFVKSLEKIDEKADCKVIKRKNGIISVENIPFTLRHFGKSIFGKELSRNYNKITFDKDIAFKNPDVEFVSFGHPLLETLIEWVIRNYSDSLKRGAVFIDPSDKYEGIIYVYETEIKDGLGQVVDKRIITIFDDGQDVQEINPATICDLAPVNIKTEISNCNPEENKLINKVLEKMSKLKQELEKQRKKIADIKQKYGIKSINILINELNAQLMELDIRKEEGDKVDHLIRQKEDRLKRYEKNRERLLEEIKKETYLNISKITNLGAIMVKKISSLDIKIKDSDQLVPDEEIERIGMKLAMDYEISQGRSPQDVSKENLGFDIKSVGKDEIRYIEVKARNKEGKIVLTPNEWFKAKRFKEQYWLYVIFFASSEPVMYIVNNPAENLSFYEQTEIVRFIVEAEQIHKKANFKIIHF